MEFDIIVIGGGPGGYNAALRGAQAGKNVAVIEKEKLGGVCLNCGCIPSKTFLQSAKVVDYANGAEKYAVNICSSESGEQGKFSACVNQKGVIDRKNRVVRKLVGGVKLSLKNKGVSVVEGEAVILGRENDLFAIGVGEEKYLCNKLIIASGSSAAMPRIDGLAQSYEEKFALTNKEIFDLMPLPEKLVVIGGGVIGLEMASYFSSCGVSVTVIEALDFIAGATDIDISTILLSNYKKKNVEFLLGATVKKIGNGEVCYADKSGELHSVQADKVLVAVGRRANKVSGIENLGIETVRNYICTNEFLQTNVENVYAVGDINGKSMLAHTAYREGEVAINNILGICDKMEYQSVPSVIYTNPEVASVGLTEQIAREQSIEVKCISIPMQYSGRYVAENSVTDGIAKFLFDRNEVLVGASLIANGASEIVTALSICVGFKVTIEQLKRVIFPHPSVSEIFREAIFE